MCLIEVADNLTATDNSYSALDMRSVSDNLLANYNIVWENMAVALRLVPNVSKRLKTKLRTYKSGEDYKLYCCQTAIPVQALEQVLEQGTVPLGFLSRNI